MSADARLVARAEELLARARSGEITYTAFLTPAEQHALFRAMPWAKGEMHTDGGYAAAERARIFFLPPYLLDLDEETRADCLADTRAECLIALEIKGSGFRELHHKDYLGAVLNLGIERDAIGDLCVTDTHTAVLFCDRVMEKFLAESLTRVANDAVKLTRITLPHGFDGGRKFQQITDTVASPRADSVGAALANLSRERAQALFREKLVEIDYEIAEKTDQQLEAPCVIVIRGKGKFIIRSLCEQTKKGRIRLLADKYL
jgi:RNA-binding protein YlmH